MLVTWFSNFVSVVIHTHMHLLQLCFYVSEFLEISHSLLVLIAITCICHSPFVLLLTDKCLFETDFVCAPPYTARLWGLLRLCPCEWDGWLLTCCTKCLRSFSSAAFHTGGNHYKTYFTVCKAHTLMLTPFLWAIFSFWSTKWFAFPSLVAFKFYYLFLMFCIFIMSKV
jgi:hypothetical protein